ncbi:hypothetical protein HDU67_008235 [Dinochytrium kinnereticum]|nr:hypothetical protein HDU67_008235 [Dinochytrium kinnereticum]
MSVPDSQHRSIVILSDRLKGAAGLQGGFDKEVKAALGMADSAVVAYVHVDREMVGVANFGDMCGYAEAVGWGEMDDDHSAAAGGVVASGSFERPVEGNCS